MGFFLSCCHLDLGLAMLDQHKHDLTWRENAFLLCSFSEREHWHNGKVVAL
jgi:hypothetical protein